MGIEIEKKNMRQIDRVDENYGEQSSDFPHHALSVAIDEAIVWPIADLRLMNGAVMSAAIHSPRS